MNLSKILGNDYFMKANPKKYLIYLTMLPLIGSLLLIFGPYLSPLLGLGWPEALHTESYTFATCSLQMIMVALAVLFNINWIFNGAASLFTRHANPDGLAVLAPLGAIFLAICSIYPVEDGNMHPITMELYATTAIILLCISAYSESLLATILEEQPQIKELNADTINHVAIWYVPILLFIAVFATAISFFIHRFQPEILFLLLLCGAPATIKLIYPLLLNTLLQLCSDYGIILQRPAAMSDLPEIDTVAFGLEGNVTKGELEVTDTISQGIMADPMLVMAASAEAYTDGPIAWAIVKEARRRKLALNDATGTNVMKGMGIEAMVNHMVIRVGSAKFLQSQGVEINNEMLLKADQLAGKGKIVVFVNSGRYCRGIIALDDVAHDTIEENMYAFQDLELEPIILTAKDRSTARYWAKQVNINSVCYELSPEDKAKEISLQQATGNGVAILASDESMDNAAFEADIAFVPNTASKELKESAQILLKKPNLKQIAEAVSLGLEWHSKLRQSICAAVIMNLFMLALGIVVLLSSSWYSFSPLIAIISALISILLLVICNYRFEK